jgi:hypothetical protein
VKIREVLNGNDRLVVIAHYRQDPTGTLYNGGGPPQNPACFLQILLSHEKISPSRKYIRLGETKGDEIMGWTNIEALEIDEILGKLDADGVKVTPVEPREPITLEAA